jgi:ankyrin repeat protein
MRDYLNNSDLHVAAKWENVRRIDLLLCSGASNTEQKNSAGETALHVAARARKRRSINILIDKGADPNARDYRLQTPVHVAAATGDYATLLTLIEKGGDVNIIDDQQQTALHKVAKVECGEKLIRLLIGEDANVNAVDNRGNTAFMVAAMNGHPSNMRTLLNCQASTLVVNLEGLSAFHLAAQHGKISALQEIVNHSVDRPFGPQGFTALELAINRSKDSYEVVKFLLDSGSDPNMILRLGSTPLHQAALFGNIEIVQLLIGSGANVNARDDLGETPIYSAVHLGYLEMVKCLVHFDTELNELNDKGETPVFLALKHPEILTYLLEQRMWTDLPRLDGSTALHIAFRDNLEEAAIILLEHGADTLIKDHEGRTAEDVARAHHPYRESAACLLLYQKMEEQREFNRTWDDDINILEDR